MNQTTKVLGFRFKNRLLLDFHISSFFCVAYILVTVRTLCSLQARLLVHLLVSKKDFIDDMMQMK